MSTSKMLGSTPPYLRLFPATMSLRNPLVSPGGTVRMRDIASPTQSLAPPVGTCSSSRTGGVPTTRWLKGIIGWSKVLTITLLEKDPATRTRSEEHTSELQ